MSALPSKRAQLRQLLTSGETQFLLEAHSGLSARIAEEAGFRGIWASGLAMSAQAGVRDNNELSWTQVLDVVELMADATRVPVLVDGDTGYGDFNNVRRLVRKLEERGAAGVCIEDKLFPKTNSFLNGERQPLATIEEFCGKLKAGRDSARDADFCLVARVEALIAGWGLDEALKRAEAYRSAGADAILIHSKRSDADEIVRFAQEWGGRLPLVIVPTKYYRTPTDVFRRAGIALVIWANHLLRSSVVAMQETARSLQASATLVELESRIAPLEEIFRLQGADELVAAERRYLSARVRPRAVILAAASGSALGAVTAQLPKTMLPIAGKPLLRRLVDSLKHEGVHEIEVIAGEHAHAIDVRGIRVTPNPEFAKSGELSSLVCARAALAGDALVLYGDLLFRRYILQELLESAAPLCAVVDSAPLAECRGNVNDLAYCSAADDRGVYRQRVELLQVSPERSWRGRAPDGRWIGMLRARGEGCEWLLEALAQLERRSDFASLGMPELLNALAGAGRPIQVIYVHGHWLDVNDLEDLQRAHAFAQVEPGPAGESR
jgi:phosphoenolpyruvate phosphomutase